MKQPGVTSQHVAHLFGDISDHRIVEILETGATLSDLEQVAALIAQADDVMGEMERPLSGPAAQVYDIVTTDPRLSDEGEERV